MSLLTNLISYWKLDGNSLDETASNNDGTDTDIAYGVENLMGYNKATDPNSRFTVTAPKVVINAITSNETARVFKDFGAGHFTGNFIHKFQFQITAGNASQGCIWGLANALNNFDALLAANEATLFATVNSAGTIQIHETYGGSQTYSPGVDSLSQNTTYYVTIERDMAVGTYGTVTLKVYSDAGRTTQVGSTLTRTLHSGGGGADFRYFYAFNSQDFDYDPTVSYFIENFVLSSEIYGKINQGAGFNGATSKIVTGNSGISGDAVFSISGWFKQTASGAVGLVGFGYTGTALAYAGIYLDISGAGSLSVEFSGGNGYRTATGQFSTGVWNYIVVTKTAGAINTTTHIYLNGVEIPSASASTDTPNITNAPIYIGTFGLSETGFLNGTIDEVGLWSRALTATEVANLYFGGLANPYPFIYNFYTSAITEGLALTGSRVMKTGKPIINAIVIDSNLTNISTFIKSFTEGILLAGLSIFNTGKTFIEGITLAGDFSYFISKGKNFTEAVILAPVFATVSNLYRTFTEAIKLTASFVFSLPRIFLEGIKLAIDYTNNFGKVFTEALVIADLTISAILTIGRTFTEGITLSGTLVVKGLKVLTESIKLTTNFITVAIFGKTFTEAIVLAGDFSAKTMRIFTEGITVAASIVFKTAKIFTEAIKLRLSNVKLVLNGIQVGLWKKIARVTNGVWHKISRHDN